MEEIMAVSLLWWVPPPWVIFLLLAVSQWYWSQELRCRELHSRGACSQVGGNPLGMGKWGCRALFWLRLGGQPGRGEHQWSHSNFHWFFMAHCGKRQNSCESWNKISLLQVKLAQLLACSESLYSTQISKCFCIKLELSLNMHIHLQTCLFCSWTLSLHSVVMSGCFHVLFWHYPVGIFFSNLKRERR